jgi:hypothetical protein
MKPNTVYVAPYLSICEGSLPFPDSNHFVQHHMEIRFDSEEGLSGHKGGLVRGLECSSQVLGGLDSCLG